MFDSLKSFALAGLCVLAIVASARADAVNPPLAVKDWSTARMRKTRDASNVVQNDFKLTNRSGAAVSDIAVVISYQTAEGREVKASSPFRVAKLAAGESKDLSIQTGMAPAFESYEVRIAYRAADGAHRVRWCGRGESGQPFFIPDVLLPGEPRIEILGDAMWTDKPGAPLRGILRVRNLGATSVERLVAKIIFTDGKAPNPRTLGTSAPVPVGDGILGGGQEKVVQFAVRNAPNNYGAYGVEFTYVTVEKESEFSRWCGGNFTGDNNVEAAHWSLQRSAARPADVALGARVRNGLAEAVESVTISITFLKNDGNGGQRVVREMQIELMEELSPGKELSVDAVLRNFDAPFDDIQRKVIYRRKNP